jgi:methionyl-tRNA formyltransferase
VKVVFFGTPEFAVPTLECLDASRHNLVAVITQPDRPKGRGRKLTQTPIKQIAEKFGYDVLQPDSVRDSSFCRSLENLKPDLLVIVAFSILPKKILRIPTLGSINLHPSLLPAYRGAAPIVWAIANGESTTGLTTFLLNANIDSGNILLQNEVPISPEETTGQLEKRLSGLGAKLVIETIDGLEDEKLDPRPQSKTGISYAPKLTKDDGRIDWTQPASTIHNRIRAFNPFPGAYTEHNNERLRIHRSLCIEAQYEEPGQIIEATPGGRLLVACGQNSISLLELQPAGKNRMSSSAFLNGNKLEIGQVLN